MLAGLDHDESRSTQKQDTAYRIQPNTPTTSLGQVKAGVVNHGQRDNSVAIGHSDVLAIDRGRSGQQLGAALLAGAVFLGGNHDLD